MVYRFYHNFFKAFCLSYLIFLILSILKVIAEAKNHWITLC
jgi:hypothetical protein